MISSRDLSGFSTPPPQRPAPRRPSPPKPATSRGTQPAKPRPGTPPPATPSTTSAPRPAEGTRETSPSAGATERSRPNRKPPKRRINLSLPLAVAQELRRFTDTQNTFYLDVVMQAHALHRESLRSDPTSDAGPPPLRRRKPVGRVQVALTIPATALGALDDDADAAGLDRSAYMTELLTVYLENVDAAER